MMELDYDDEDLYVSEEERQEGEDLAVLAWEASRGEDRKKAAPPTAIDLTWPEGEAPF